MCLIEDIDARLLCCRILLHLLDHLPLPAGHRTCACQRIRVAGPAADRRVPEGCLEGRIDGPPPELARQECISALETALRGLLARVDRAGGYASPEELSQDRAGWRGGAGTPRASVVAMCG
jgi:hypothetical protein